METYDALCKARWLIGQQRYEEARALLRTIHHAQAAEWLARLDEIEHTPFADRGVPLERFVSEPRRWRCWPLSLGIGGGVLLVVCISLAAVTAIILALI